MPHMWRNVHRVGTVNKQPQERKALNVILNNLLHKTGYVFKNIHIFYLEGKIKYPI
jgi:hypothetical protein